MNFMRNLWISLAVVSVHAFAQEPSAGPDQPNKIEGISSAMLRHSADALDAVMLLSMLRAGKSEAAYAELENRIDANVSILFTLMKRAPAADQEAALRAFQMIKNYRDKYPRDPKLKLPAEDSSTVSPEEWQQYEESVERAAKKAAEILSKLDKDGPTKPSTATK